MPPLTPQPGTSINLSAMGVTAGQVIVLAPGHYQNIVAHNCAKDVAIYSPDGARATVGAIDIAGNVSGLTIRDIDVRPGASPPDVAVSAVAGDGCRIQNLTLDNVTAVGFLKGFSFDRVGSGYIKSLALLNLLAAECGSLGYFINDAYGFAEGCVAYKCGGSDPNRDPTMTRGAYVNGPGLTWRRGFFGRCAMNGIRGGGAQLDNLALGCGMAFLRGDATKRVAGNVAMLSRDCVPSEPWRAIVGGFEGSASFDCEVTGNLSGFHRGLGATYAYSEHGDGSMNPAQRYGNVRYTNNGAIAYDHINSAAVGFGFDELGGAVMNGVAGCWAAPQLSGLVSEIKDPSKWIIGPGGLVSRPMASMKDPTRDPQRYAREVLGTDAQSDDAAIEAIYQSIVNDRQKIGEAIAWFKDGVRLK